MCLNVDKSHPKQRDGSIRWKLMQVCLDDQAVMGTNHEGGQHRVGDWRVHDGPKPGDWRVQANLRERYDPANHGIHVCASMNDLRKIRCEYSSWSSPLAFVKVECHGFYAGGVFSGDAGSVNETWEKVKILEIIPAFSPMKRYMIYPQC
jgi:hypothetical protein